MHNPEELWSLWCRPSTSRIETSHDATESHHAESGSGQKTATAHSVSDHEKSMTRTMTASHAHDRLTANGKRSESDSDVHESKTIEHPFTTLKMNLKL